MEILAIFAFALSVGAVSLDLTTSYSLWGSYAQDQRFGSFVNDGGTGGTINNIHLIALSDAHRDDLPFPLHTSYAYQDASNPNSIRVVADYRQNPPVLYNGDNAGVISYIAGVDPPEFASGNFAPAPRVAPIPIPGNQTGGLCVWPVHLSASGPYSFNTMFEINVLPFETLDAQHINVPAVRTKPILFNVAAGEIGYGSRGLTSGRLGETGQYFYAWEGDNTGLKLARVPWATRTDHTTWDYWNSAKGEYHHGSTELILNNAIGNVLTIEGQGTFEFGFDVTYVDRFNTYIMTYNYNATASSIYASYSLSGNIEGPYSPPKPIFQPQYDYTDCKADASHPSFPAYGVQAHWDYYGTNSNTLLVSWVSCVALINFANVTFTQL